MRQRAGKPAIFAIERPLNGFPRMVTAAIETDDPADVSVQLDDIRAAGAPVQAVDVLRHQLPERPGPLETSQRVMCGVWGRARDDRPPDQATRPIAPAHRVGS